MASLAAEEPALSPYKDGVRVYYIHTVSALCNALLMLLLDIFTEPHVHNFNASACSQLFFYRKLGPVLKRPGPLLTPVVVLPVSPNNTKKEN